MNDSQNKKPTKYDSTSVMTGLIIYAILIVIGLIGTITSASQIYALYQDRNIEWMIIIIIFGLFMLAWFIYFSKEFYHLVKQRMQHDH
ncbi:MAG: hypothetical protein ACI35R_00575 [Bacillus sp. (in: firmicutes)]